MPKEAGSIEEIDASIKERLSFQVKGKSLRDEADALLSFIGWLRTIRPAPQLISKNGASFDIPFIMSRCIILNIDPPLDIIRLGHTDIHYLTKKWISLDDNASLYCLPHKSGSGLQAITWFRAGEYDRIARYCMDDVVLTFRCFAVYLMLKRLYGGE